MRILRAIKFAARLDFQIEPSAWEAILVHKRDIPKCAAPRVLEEIYRLLRGGAARRSVELLLETGVMEMLLPDLSVLLTDGAESQGARWMWGILDRIDEHPDRAPSNAVLLSALIGPLVGEALFDDEPGQGKPADIGQLIEDRSRPLVERMKVSRRDAERTRQILLAQRRIAPSKRRRGRSMTLVRRDYFDEALEVYELVGQVVRPVDEAREELSRWRQLQGEGGDASAVPPGEGEGAPGEMLDAADPDESGDGDPEGDEPRRRRRRRGGRGRRGRSDEAPSARPGAGASGSSTKPAARSAARDGAADSAGAASSAGHDPHVAATHKPPNGAAESAAVATRTAIGDGATPLTVEVASAARPTESREGADRIDQAASGPASEIAVEGGTPSTNGRTSGR